MKVRVLRAIISLCIIFASVLMYAAAPSSKDKPTYESLLSEVRLGYLKGRSDGPLYMEIVENNFGIKGLERLYGDVEKDARFDQRMQIFRDYILKKRIEQLKEINIAVVTSSEDKPTYESLLNEVRLGYLKGRSDGPLYMEIVENNFGIKGLERLYGDVEEDARFDQRMQLFRDYALKPRIEELKKTKVAAVSSSEDKLTVRAKVVQKLQSGSVAREASVSKEIRQRLEHANKELLIAGGKIDLNKSNEFKKVLIEAMKEKGCRDLRAISGNDLYPDLPIDKTYQFSQILTGELVPSYNLFLTSKVQTSVSLEQAEAAIKEAVKLYKIHFMPSDKNFKDIVLSLIGEIKKNKELASCISFFKIKPILDEDLLRDPACCVIVPKIVVYCIGKETSQKALNILYEKYKKEEGSGQIPPFNEKVTDLIYYTQGHRQDKFVYPQYYEQPDMVYFFPTVTGIREDYHLNNPVKK